MCIVKDTLIDVNTNIDEASDREKVAFKLAAKIMRDLWYFLEHRFEEHSKTIQDFK